MKTNTFYVNFSLLIILTLLLSSCKKDEEVNPFDPIAGSYNGYYKYEDGGNVTEDNNHPLVITEIKTYGSTHYTIATIGSMPVNVKLDNLTPGASGLVTGQVKLYKPGKNIYDDGEQVAGSGSFSYQYGKVTILWTADQVNGGWSITYISK